MFRKKRYRSRTTDSGHGYRIYDDLLNMSPKFIPYRNGSLVVCDITYIYTTEGFAYLSLVTDAYSRFIVGYSLNRILEVEGLAKEYTNPRVHVHILERRENEQNNSSPEYVLKQ